MSLASDDRGRVPFALVGVLLLLGSVAYAHTLALRGPVSATASADAALDRAESAARPAVRSAAAAAAREAARHPVTAPANTSAGRVLNGSTPFRDALRIRTYLAAADALPDTAVREGDVRAAAALPAVESAADLPAAKRRVGVAPVDGGTAVRVTVRNVPLVARADGRAAEGESDAGRVLARERATFSVVVALPVLAMHDRTARYERRLNAGPLDGPGFGRRLTWRLGLLTEARGLAQYGGAPVENVLPNRYVELSANGAALREQRAAFGRADPDGRAALARATGRVGATDLLDPAVRRGPAWTDTVLSAADAAGIGDERTSGAATDGLAPVANATGADSIPVGVNATADGAFVALLDDGFDATLRDAYRATATRRIGVRTLVDGERPPRTPPGDGWALAATRTATDRTVVERADGSAAADREFAVHRRTVRVDRAAVRTWVGPNATTRRTRASWTDRYAVDLSLRGAYDPDVPGPDRPTDPVFAAGGALDGPALSAVPDEARSRLLAGPARADALARRAAADTAGSTETTTVAVTPPAALDAWVYADVARLRERVRNVTVPVARDAVAAGTANAPARLAAALRDRRAGLVDAPAAGESYDGPADRARVAVRAAYLGRVLAALDARAAGAADRNGAFADALRDGGVAFGDRLDDLSRAAADVTAPTPRPVGAGPAGAVTLTPHAEPGYLTLSAVTHRDAPAVPAGESVHPLAARNTNVFTLPHGDAADTVTDAAVPAERTVSLRTAGRALAAADRTLDRRPNATLRERRDGLHAAVGGSMHRIRTRALAVLRTRAPSLSPAERRVAVRAADDRWPGLGPRAVAATNGSYADALAAAAAERGLAPAAADRLGVRLRVALADEAGRERVAVPASVTNATASARREVARTALRDAVSNGTGAAERAIRKRYEDHAFGGVLAGLPVAPAPGYWYATANVWSVEVRGVYPRFAVTAPVGGPTGAGGRVRYVRDGSAVTLDVDGDGDDERLGRNERVSFRVETAVGAVVPPGRSGVGDVDGDADERSAGWPCPGVGADNRSCTG